MSDKKNIVDILGKPFTGVPEKIVNPPEIQLRDAMQAAGITPPSEIVLDGTLRRFSTNGRKHDTAGWYVAFSGAVPAGSFGNWREGSSHSWRAEIGRELSVAEQMAHTKRVAEMRAIRDRELAERRETAAEKAQAEWDAAALASDDHPYLVAKKVGSHGILRVAGDGRLIAPVFIDGELSSLQFIAADGSKLFLKGGAVSGGYCVVGGSIRDSRVLYLCEGVATAISIHDATGAPVVVAFSANNLPPAGKAVRDAVGPATTMVVVADNDVSGTGQREAQRAAELIGGRLVVVPVEGQDANDYVQAGGDLTSLLAPPAPVQTDGYLMAADEFCASPKPIRWLIKRQLQREALIMIHGPSGGGKTFVMLDMALHVASSKPQWCGQRVHGGPVVILAGEGHSGLRSRLAAWKRHHGVSQLNAWISRAGVDLNTAEGYSIAREAIMALPERPSLIVIDTLHRHLFGDENSAQDAKSMIDACGALMREFGAAVVLIHHTGVNEEAQHRARGSSAWRGALEIEISVVPGKEPGEPLSIVQRKAKDAELAETVHMRLQKVELDWIDEDGERVSSAVPVQVTADQIAAAIPKESKAEGAARKLFEDAWMARGILIGADPFLSVENWRAYLQDEAFTSDGARRTAFSSAKKRLLESGYLVEKLDGFMVADPTAAFALKASRDGV